MNLENNSRWSARFSKESIAEDIASQVQKLMSQKTEQQVPFYSLMFDALTISQGDVIKIESEIPLIAEDGMAATDINETNLWLVIGNTCDFDRSVNEVPFSQIIPLSYVDCSIQNLKNLRTYNSARRFYLPPWNVDEKHYAADFTIPITIHKMALKNCAVVLARMTKDSWSLLHLSLIRFLARDDGREE